jgi:hypothetical protein
MDIRRRLAFVVPDNNADGLHCTGQAIGNASGLRYGDDVGVACRTMPEHAQQHASRRDLFHIEWPLFPPSSLYLGIRCHRFLDLNYGGFARHHRQNGIGSDCQLPSAS